MLESKMALSQELRRKENFKHKNKFSFFFIQIPHLSLSLHNKREKKGEDKIKEKRKEKKKEKEKKKNILSWIQRTFFEVWIIMGILSTAESGSIWLSSPTRSQVPPPASINISSSERFKAGGGNFPKR